MRASSSALGQAGKLTQRPSVAIGGNRRQSVLIRRNLSHSGALSRTHVHSVALRCTQVQAGALRCKQVQASAPWRRARALCLRRWPPHTVFEPRGAAEPPETTTRVQNHQRHSVALSGTPRHSHSVALSGTRRSEAGQAAPAGSIQGTQGSSEAIRVTHGASRGHSTCRSRSRSGCVRWSISSPALRSSLWLSRTSIA